MLVGRVVAAKCPAALLAGSEVNPTCAYFNALLTLPLFGELDGSDRTDVSARGVSSHERDAETAIDVAPVASSHTWVWSARNTQDDAITLFSLIGSSAIERKV